MMRTYSVVFRYLNAQFIYDDGFTGTSFNHPVWKRVEAQIKSSQVKNPDRPEHILAGP